LKGGIGMSVYDEITQWVIDDIIEDMEENERDKDDLDMLLEDYIQQNLDDLSESIWDRREDMREIILRKMYGE
jgi:hypothetical protein